MLAKRKKAYTHDVVVMDTAKDVIQPKIWTRYRLVRTRRLGLRLGRRLGFCVGVLVGCRVGAFVGWQAPLQMSGQYSCTRIPVVRSICLHLRLEDSATQPSQFFPTSPLNKYALSFSQGPRYGLGCWLIVGLGVGTSVHPIRHSIGQKTSTLLPPDSGWICRQRNRTLSPTHRQSCEGLPSYKKVGSLIQLDVSATCVGWNVAVLYNKKEKGQKVKDKDYVFVRIDARMYIGLRL